MKRNHFSVASPGGRARAWAPRGPAVAIAVAASGSACLDVAEGRAERDLEVGRAEAAGVRFEVEGGLAAVRAAEPGRVALWAGAPQFTLRASAGVGGQWRLSVENALPDLALDARREGGGPIAVTAEASGSVPTERAWSLELPPGEAATLSLAPPDAADESPYRFAVFSDVQERIDDVQDIYAKMNEDPSIRFSLISGDLTERGTRPQLERFQREMKSLAFPCYATLGNHELGTADGLYQEYFGRGNYHFAFRGVHFTMLDSASATIAAPVYDWLEGWLAEGAGRAHVVDMHIPPLDPVGGRNGGFASRAEANKLLTEFADGNVDLTLYGHLHSYYAYSNAGIPAFVAGGGGSIPERLDGVGRHFLTVDVEPRTQRLQVALVRVDLALPLSRWPRRASPKLRTCFGRARPSLRACEPSSSSCEPRSPRSRHCQHVRRIVGRSVPSSAGCTRAQPRRVHARFTPVALRRKGQRS